MRAGRPDSRRALAEALMQGAREPSEGRSVDEPWDLIRDAAPTLDLDLDLDLDLAWSDAERIDRLLLVAAAVRWHEPCHVGINPKPGSGSDAWYCRAALTTRISDPASDCR